jgi:Tannase and feruloyl esterase
MRFDVRARAATAVAFFGFLSMTSAHALDAAQCAALTGLNVPATTITSATMVAATATVPQHCLVRARVDAEIEFNLGLPAAWNGKFYHQDGGGFVGSIPGINAGLTRGYASVATNTGHVGNGVAALDGSWALDRLDRQINFGHRGIHVVTVAAKDITQRAYGSAPKHSYFQGCSNGGRQALNEVQRYPKDFDGVIAGAPALDWTGLMVGFNWNSRAVRAAPIPPAKLTLIANEAAKRCDADDGLADGLIDKPLRCDFDPAVLTCNGPDGPNCLTPAQVSAVKKVYAGPSNSRGRQIYLGFPPGAEGGATPGEGQTSGWQNWISGPGNPAAPVLGNPLQYTFQDHYLKYFVFSNPNYDSMSFDYDRDPKALRATGAFINAKKTDISAFRKAGGKLILWHGWADHALMAERTIEYYEDVVDRMGSRKRADRFMRLFLAPGMHHCSNGPGPNVFDALTALENWVEKGIAPASMVATKYANNNVAAGVVERTRPLCPYPQRARYIGTGSINDAANFTCRGARHHDHDDDKDHDDGKDHDD